MKYLLPIIFLATPFLAVSQWNADPNVADTKVATTPYSETQRISITDNAGGSIVLFRSSNYDDDIEYLYAQRIDANGYIKWGTYEQPILISTSYNDDLYDAIPDGSGGAFVALIKYSEDDIGDIYLQHINNTGAITWTVGGVKVTNNDGNFAYDNCRLELGLSGNVIITWDATTYDEETEQGTAEVYAQLFQSSGEPGWQNDGIPICTDSSARFFPEIVTDGNGGVIIFFADARNSVYDPDNEFSNVDIYAQRLNAQGNRLWGDLGVLVSDAYIYELIDTYGSQALSDGAGGAIVAFQVYDFLVSGEAARNIYAQHLDASGTRTWPSASIPINVDGKTTRVEGVISDGLGGAVISWSYTYDDDETNSKIQHLTISGNKDWSFTSSTSEEKSIINDGLGNYIFTWREYITSSVIKAQKISSSGTRLWSENGVPVCSNPAAFAGDPQIVGSENGSAIITWPDQRNVATSLDIYANKINGSGVLPLRLKSFSATFINKQVKLEWTTAMEYNIKEFIVERSFSNTPFSSIATVVAKKTNSLTNTYEIFDSKLSGGDVFYRLKIVEKDGSFSYSNIEKISVSTNGISIQIKENPVRDNLTFTINSSVQSRCSIIIIDAGGKTAIIKDFSLLSGLSSVSFNVTNLAKQQYFIKIIEANGSVIYKGQMIKY